MSLINSTAIPSGATDYEIEQSLRFEDGRSTYLTKTPTTTSNRKTWTFSTWLKLGNLGANRNIFGAGSNYDEYTVVFIRGDGKLQFGDKDSGADRYWQSDMVFRDTSAFYHLLIAVDTTQGTDTNRLKIYVNGSQITLNNTNGQYSSSEDTYMNLNTKLNWIGADQAAAADYDGYLAETHFIDGTALNPTSFGETGDYGEFKPIEVEGLTYGTNGFYLNFAGGGIMSATGGNSTATDGDFKAASFTANGTFTPSADGYVEYLVIGGGGAAAGASNAAVYGGSGAGGAGGYRTGMLPVTGGTGYSIVVGAGGVGRTYAASGTGNTGADSSFSSITSGGGGGGCGYGAIAATMDDASAGGAMGKSDGSSSAAGGSTAYGNAGGAGGGTGTANATAYGAGGGGGAGAVGVSGSGSAGGNGGAGLASSITGSSVTRAGGGGGGTYNGIGTLGSGGSGGGGGASHTTGTAGTANTGSGGGASNVAANSGGSGGSGIVIIRYKFQ